jgi:hypothetical protein
MTQRRRVNNAISRFRDEIILDEKKALVKKKKASVSWTSS